MNKTKYKLIIGIDPDIDKCGVAVLDVASKTISLNDMDITMLIYHVFEILKPYKRDECAVVVEIDRAHCHNWHLTPYDTKASAASKGFDQGRCFSVAETLCQFFNYANCEVVEKAPLVKMWSGPDRKITHEELTSLVGLNFSFKTKRRTSNQEQRDAALLALDVSDIPIILSPKKRKDRQTKSF